MRKAVKSRAEENYASSQRKTAQFLHEKERAREEMAERVARLKALRLAKEAEDKQAAALATAAKAAKKA